MKAKKSMAGFMELYGRIVNRIFDGIVISAVHLLLCIPIITIGGAETALYTVCWQWGQGEDSSILDYFRVFRKEWKGGIAQGLLSFLAIAVLALDVMVCSVESCPVLMRAITVGVILFGGSVIAHGFLLNALFEGTVRRNVKNAVIIAVTYPFKNLITAAAAVLIWIPALRAYVIARVNRSTYSGLCQAAASDENNS